MSAECRELIDADDNLRLLFECVKVIRRDHWVNHTFAEGLFLLLEIFNVETNKRFVLAWLDLVLVQVCSDSMERDQILKS